MHSKSLSPNRPRWGLRLRPPLQARTLRLPCAYTKIGLKLHISKLNTSPIAGPQQPRDHSKPINTDLKSNAAYNYA